MVQSARISKPVTTSRTIDATTSATTSAPRTPLLSADRPCAMAQIAAVAVRARPQHRGEPEDEHGHDGEDGGEGEHAEVDRWRRRCRQRRGHEPVEQRHHGNREQDSEAAADGTEQRALGCELSNQPLAPGAERGPHGELLASPERARQQQADEIGADDEHHADGGATERQSPSSAIRPTALRGAGSTVAPVFSFSFGYWRMNRFGDHGQFRRGPRRRVAPGRQSRRSRAGRCCSGRRTPGR